MPRGRRRAGDRPPALGEARGLGPAAVHDRVRDRRRGRARRSRRSRPSCSRGPSRGRSRVSRSRASELAAGERPGPLPVRARTRSPRSRRAFNQMADDLHRAKEAERSFLLSVSHELKTPLASIRGHGEALLDGVMRVPKAAGVVVAGVEAARAARSRPPRPRAAEPALVHGHAAERVDLAALVQEALGRHEAEAERVGVSLVAPRRTAPAPRLADPDRVLQVLSNLIENALRSRRRRRASPCRPRPAELTVADTGPGLAPDDLPRAFDRFFLYSRYASTGQSGPASGWRSSRSSSRRWTARSRSRAQPGAGTTFVIRLPP